VLRIVHDDLSLKCVKKRRVQELTQSNRVVRLQHTKKLLQMFPDDKVDFIWFTDEKFLTVSSNTVESNTSVRSGRHHEEAGHG